MTRQAEEDLMDRWINDPGVRQEMPTDPERTVGGTRLSLDQDEWAALRNIDWTPSTRNSIRWQTNTSQTVRSVSAALSASNVL